MGQSMPLPKRIPRPDIKTESGREVAAALEKAGIHLEEEHTDTKSNDKYALYTMPVGWKMVDDSLRQDLPNFYIVDDKNMQRFNVAGVWKETYDNDLWIEVTEPPIPFKAQNKKEPLVPNQTSKVVLRAKLKEAFKLNPLKRPSLPLTASRIQDHDTGFATPPKDEPKSLQDKSDVKKDEVPPSYSSTGNPTTSPPTYSDSKHDPDSLALRLGVAPEPTVIVPDDYDWDH